MKKFAEELTGSLAGFGVSLGIYLPEIAHHAINSAFVLGNTVLAVFLSHKVKQFLERKDHEQ